MRFTLPILLLAGLTATGALLAQTPANAPNVKVHTIHQFRLPDIDENGRIRGEIFGDTARVPEKGLIDITNMRLITYDLDGTVLLRVTAPHCAYDRERHLAGSPSNVLIESRDFILSGEGFRCHLRRQRLEIANKARLVIGSIRGHSGSRELLP